MKKNFVIGIIGIGLLLAVVFVIYLLGKPGGKTVTPETNVNLSKVVDIDEIARHPDHFKGSIEVVGRVVKVDESKAIFVLGCEDVCVAMPVRYGGQMPNLGSEVVVYGEIKETEGKYIFEGQQIKAR